MPQKHCKISANYQEMGNHISPKGSTQEDFPNTTVPEIPNTNHDLPNYPTDTTDSKLVYFVDAAYGNNPTKI